MRRLALVASVAIASGCSGTDAVEPVLTAPSMDAGADALPDASAPPDGSSHDTTSDPAQDAPADSIFHNPSSDASPDAPETPPPEAGHDASEELADDATTPPDDAANPPDATLDSPADSPPESTGDAAPDAIADAVNEPPTGPVGPGSYSYSIVPTYSLLNPPAVAWHPSGDYALVLNATNEVFRFDRAAGTLSQVASTSASLTWRNIEFAPGGDNAVLLGNDTTAKDGRIYVWNHASAQLSELATERYAGGTYEAAVWSPDGQTCRLLGSRSGSGYIATLWKLDLATGRSDAKPTNTSAGCQDIAWATDQFDAAAVAMVCGVNGASLLHLNGGGQFVLHSGNVGNTSRVAARPQGDYALAVCWSCNSKIYRFQQGTWLAPYDSPIVQGGYAVGFSTDGRRALILGGYSGVTHGGQVYEYRHDLLKQSELLDVSIPNFDQPPWSADTYVDLNDVAWRPGCDAGLIVGGANTYSSKKGYLIRFQVDNGTPCP